MHRSGVRCHAHNHVIGKRRSDLLTERIPAAEIPAREKIVDDCHFARPLVIAFGELPTREQRDAERAEIARPDRVTRWRGPVRAGLHPLQLLNQTRGCWKELGQLKTKHRERQAARVPLRAPRGRRVQPRCRIGLRFWGRAPRAIDDRTANPRSVTLKAWTVRTNITAATRTTTASIICAATRDARTIAEDPREDASRNSDIRCECEDTTRATPE